MFIVATSDRVIAKGNPSIAAQNAGVRKGAGVQCAPYPLFKPFGPVNFSVKDVGGVGVPSLDLEQRTVLTSVARYVPTRAMRFVFVTDPESQFVVYLASNGPCGKNVVLNLSCNTHYEPVNDPRHTGADAGCNGPRPWIDEERTYIKTHPWTAGFYTRLAKMVR